MAALKSKQGGGAADSHSGSESGSSEDSHHSDPESDADPTTPAAAPAPALASTPAPENATHSDGNAPLVDISSLAKFGIYSKDGSQGPSQNNEPTETTNSKSSASEQQGQVSTNSLHDSAAPGERPSSGLRHSSSQSSTEALAWLRARSAAGSRRASADDGASARAAASEAAGTGGARPKRSLRHSASGSDLQSVVALLSKVRKMNPTKINPALRKRVRVIAEKHIQREHRRASQAGLDGAAGVGSADGAAPT